jgi:hypothetical protein
VPMVAVFWSDPSGGALGCEALLARRRWRGLKHGQDVVRVLFRRPLRWQKATAIASSLSAPMQQLLAALTVRVGTNDPAGRWTMWHCLADQSQLGGDGDRWKLQWKGQPSPPDLVGALTDPIADLPGARSVAERFGRYIDITLGDARLRHMQ